MARVFVEGYGCSMNLNDTEKIKGFLGQNSFSLTDFPEGADLIVINTCAVKEQTETKMLSRISELKKIALQNNARLIVSGCLPKVNNQLIQLNHPETETIGTSLSELAALLDLEPEEFSPKVPDVRQNEFVSIITINKGCLSNCAFCAVPIARGKLQSHPVEQLNEKFRQAVSETKEIWLTSQDAGCYGRDINSSLPMLLQEFLSNEGDFRLRIGMMNPQWLRLFIDELIEIYRDDRMYKFLHLPIQSGSNKVLMKMRRGYRVETFIELVQEFKRKIPELHLSTDVIAGFPSETEEDFQETVDVIKTVRPDTTNISRFGARPGTSAYSMPEQLNGAVKKNRSRVLSKICAEISFENSLKFVGSRQRIFVSEKGYKGNFIGRTLSYRPVAVTENLLGEFCNVRLKEAMPKCFIGELIETPEQIASVV